MERTRVKSHQTGTNGPKHEHSIAHDYFQGNARILTCGLADPKSGREGAAWPTGKGANKMKMGNRPTGAPS